MIDEILFYTLSSRGEKGKILPSFVFREKEKFPSGRQHINRK